MPPFRLRNIRLRAVARRQRGSGPSHAEEICKPFHPDKIKNSSTANAPPPQEVSPSRGAIVRVVIPPGAKECSKISVCHGVVLRVPERSAWFISRPGEKTEKRYFRVRFDATIIYPKVVKEVARENEQPSSQGGSARHGRGQDSVYRGRKFGRVHLHCKSTIVRETCRRPVRT